VFRWDGRHYRAAHNHGNPPDIAERFADFRVASDDPLIVAAFEASACIAINDAAGSEMMDAETARRAGIRSIAVAPMSAGPDRLGFMTAEYNERSGVFSDLDATLLQGISRVAAGVMQGPPDQR
jgi:GAF domain-containing protein